MILTRATLAAEVAHANRSGVSLHLLLVGCGKDKLPTASEAWALYTGDLTRKRLDVAAVIGMPAVILSGRHGLLLGGTVVDPYEATHPRGAARDALCAHVRAQLAGVGAAHGLTLHVWAGADYVRLVEQATSGMTAKVIPGVVQGMIGMQKQGYKRFSDSLAAIERTLETA